MDKLEKAFEEVLNTLYDYGYIDLEDENFDDTPKRMAKMYLEFLEGEFNKNEVERLFSKSFPSEYSGMVISKNIRVVGLCPHHFLPVNYVIDVGYIPRENVIGVSKLHRICKILASRAVLQEDLTYDIIHNIDKYLEPEGAIVIVEGLHGCMVSRGIKQENPIVTSQISGEFNDLGVRNEFLQLIKRR